MLNKTEEQIDNDAVDQLALMMKKKLAEKRAQGSGGWSDEDCPLTSLSRLLVRAVMRGDPVDVANYAAFIQARGGKIDYLPLTSRLEAMEKQKQEEQLHSLLEVVDLPWVDHEGVSTVTVLMVNYSVLPDVEDKGKYRAYYGKGRHRQVGSIEEGKAWVQQDHLKGKLLSMLRLKESV